MEGVGASHVFRTPDERFRGLPDFDFEPHYREVDRLRLAHLDVGDGPPIVMLHGEPAWSFNLAQGHPAAELIPSAGHGLQEDQGPLLGERIAAWLAEGR
jgi:hypothetical protein